MGKIAINGKFLGANLNGVHRTAAHYAHELMLRAGDAHEVRLVTTPGAQGHPDFPSLKGEPLARPFAGGQGWEMVSLPMATRGSLLLNFCNLAPMAHGNGVVMIHDAQTFLFPEDYTGRQATFYRLLLPWIARRARRILTVSEFSRQSLAEHGVGTLDKIDVVHNGTDHILMHDPDKAVLARNGLVEGGYVFALGSTKGYKNMRAVFAAMAEPLAQDVKLVLAGGADEKAYRAAGMTPPPGTIFPGFIDDAELRALYAGAAAFVFPSLTEGFGLPPVEAMHCGTPVVAARAGAMPEVLQDAAILVTADDPGAYREALGGVLGSPERAGELREKGSRRAAQLSWSAAGDRLYSLVERLL